MTLLWTQQQKVGKYNLIRACPERQNPYLTQRWKVYHSTKRIDTQISNRGRLGLGQLKELQIEWHSWHQFLKSVGPNSSLLNLLLYWILTFRVALKITVYLGYYKTNQKWNLGWHQVFHVHWQMVSCWFLSYKSYLWLL